MAKINQRGIGAVEIFILILVVVLLGAAGYVIWSKQSASESKVSEQENDNTPRSPYGAGDKLITSHASDGLGVDVSFEHPESWKISQVTEGPVPIVAEQSTSRKTTLKIPSLGHYIVTYEVDVNGGFGGACDPADTTVGTITKPSSTKTTNFASANYVEYRTSLKPDVTFIGGLMDTSVVNKTAVGKSQCDLYMAGLIPLNDDKSIVLVKAQIDTDGTFSVDDTPSIYQYDQAKAILLSTQVK